MDDPIDVEKLCEEIENMILLFYQAITIHRLTISNCLF